MSAATIQPNSYATIAYTLRSADGEVLDGSTLDGGEPIEYVHGYAMLVPGLEAALVGLRVGDKKDIVVSAEEGFGTRDDELVLEIDRADFPDPANVKIGDEFVAESADGEEVAMRVIAVEEQAVRVDANHPLAGVELHYTVEIQAIRDATPEEIAEAAAELEAAEAEHGGHVCSGDHDHGDHDHQHPIEQSELIPLGRKPSGSRSDG